MRKISRALKERFFPEPIFRQPRIWSNNELMKFAPRYKGAVVNVSAWKDEDKRGKKYRDYFSSASSYDLTNWEGTHGLQGNEIKLDLQVALPEELKKRWDVVFNHTTLEHVYEFRKAFENLCAMSKDTVIIVVPWYQQLHVDQDDNDWWRFSELAIRRLFEEEGFDIEYISTGGSSVSLYVFCVAHRR